MTQPTATGSTVFVVEIQALQKLLSEKDSEIERLTKELAFQTDMACQADVACMQLKALCARAADLLDPEINVLSSHTAEVDELLFELRKVV
jgi:hypothetical protein